MPDLWRISNHRDLTGGGGLRYSARWHTAGRRVVYLAESPAGALIEVLVHLELDETDLPPAYTLLRVAVAPEVVAVDLPVPANDAWKAKLMVTRALGDEWLKSGRSALARVPSAILPDTFNLLLNPQHAQASLVAIVEATSARLDPRLLHGPVKK